jgi:hypothetical protein
VEQVGQAPPSAHKGDSKEGGIRLGKSLTALVLRDVTPCLRLVGCIPGDVDKDRQVICECDNICKCNNTCECNKMDCTSESDTPISLPPPFAC